MHEVQIQQPGYNILRRRAAIVLGQWLPVRDGLDRTLVYQIFQHLLDERDSSNDQVVRVTSGRQLKSVVEPFEFAPEQFMPFAPAILGSIMALIQQVELLETKMALLGTVGVIVTKMERLVSCSSDQEPTVADYGLRLLLSLINSLPFYRRYGSKLGKNT